MSFVTAHVLDASAGRPAVGVGVTLSDASGSVLAQAVTNDDGRVPDLGPESLEPGTYEVRFSSGDHFAAQDVACFHPYVPVGVPGDADDAVLGLAVLVRSQPDRGHDGSLRGVVRVWTSGGAALSCRGRWCTRTG